MLHEVIIQAVCRAPACGGGGEGGFPQAILGAVKPNISFNPKQVIVTAVSDSATF